MELTRACHYLLIFSPDKTQTTTAVPSKPANDSCLGRVKAARWVARNAPLSNYLDLLPVVVQLLLVFFPAAIPSEGGLSPVGPDVGQRYAQPPRQGPQELLVSGEAVHRQGELFFLVQGSGSQKIVVVPAAVGGGAVVVGAVAAVMRVVRVNPQQSQAFLVRRAFESWERGARVRGKTVGWEKGFFLSRSCYCWMHLGYRKAAAGGVPPPLRDYLPVATLRYIINARLVLEVD